MSHRRTLAAAIVALALLAAPIGPIAAADAPPSPTPTPTDGPMPGPLPTPQPGQCTQPLGPKVDLSHCDLTGADLSDLDLTGADLSGAVLNNADLSGTVLNDVTAPDVEMTHANLIGASLLRADLSDAEIDGSNLRKAHLSGADLSGASLEKAVLSAARLDGADLTDADLDDAIVDGATFERANLTGADAGGIDFTAAALAGAVLVDTDLTQADLSKLDLTGAALIDADLTGATARATLFVDADLRSANLTNAVLLKADLTRAAQADVTWWNTTCPDGKVVTGTPCLPVRENAEAGFMRLKAIDYSFKTGWSFPSYLPLTTTPANLFYTFQPAEGNDATTAPLFVMLNGGPGAATTANLFANNTAPFTVNKEALPLGSPGYTANPDSWTSFGNLLYIDPAQTGFSYNLNSEAVDDPARRFSDYFQTGNFNPFIDADQVLRVVLMFLDAHPELRKNPIVLVGESYGGTRVSTMLNMVLFSGKYDADGPLFRDPELVSMITAHFREIGIDDPTPQRAASQFSRQILIQPQLTSYQGDVQSDMYWTPADVRSPIDEVAEGSGHPGAFTRNKWRCGLLYKNNLGACAIMVYVDDWGRDRYNWAKPKTWSDDQEAWTTAQFYDAGKLNTILGVDVGQIPGFTAKDRAGQAYHYLFGIPWMDFSADGVTNLPGATDDQDQALSEALQDGGGSTGSLYPLIVDSQRAADQAEATVPYDASLVGHYGKLAFYDRYFIGWNPDVYIPYAANPFALEARLPINQDSSPIYGELFLQNARYVDTFLTSAKYDLVIYSPALPVALGKHAETVSDVSVQQTMGTGRVTIAYKDGQQVSLYYPSYLESGHAVAATQPKKLHDDVATWLQCTLDGSCRSQS